MMKWMLMLVLLFGGVASCSGPVTECDTDDDCGEAISCMDGECFAENNDVVGTDEEVTGEQEEKPDPPPTCEDDELLFSKAQECDCEDSPVRYSCDPLPAACETLITEASMNGPQDTLQNPPDAEYCGCLVDELIGDVAAESAPYCRCGFFNGKLRFACTYPE